MQTSKSVQDCVINAPLVSKNRGGKNTNNTKSEVTFKQLIRDPWCVHNRLLNANFEEKSNEHPI
jgi:hypothetical protein